MTNLIRTEEENRIALLLVERLMESDPEPESRDGIFLKALADEIQEFEKIYDAPVETGNIKEAPISKAEEIIGKIGAELLRRHSPQNVLDAYFEVANELLENENQSK